MPDTQAIELLKQALRRLPGVGPKSAQRMAFHFLERDREGAMELAEALKRAVSAVKHCQRCNNFSEADLCRICASPRRDGRLLCVVETPADLDSIEQSGVYSGLYVVLMGRLAPLDGIGPDQIAIDHLVKVIEQHDVIEVILATNLTAEGEATGAYITELLAGFPVKVTRLARGVPLGGELEYMDAGTLSQAFTDRRSVAD